MAGHSPGPWTPCLEGKCQCGLIHSVPADAPIAKVLFRNQEEGVEYPLDVVVANARLVAAAPTLIEFLRQWSDVHPTGQLAHETRALVARLSPPQSGGPR
jgi:hypothetical protein